MSAILSSETIYDMTTCIAFPSLSNISNSWVPPVFILYDALETVAAYTGVFTVNSASIQKTLNAKTFLKIVVSL